MIESTLKDKIGLNIASIGSAKVNADIAKRMEACGLESVEDYDRLLLSSKDELAKLIELITIPETWFFRGREAFAFLEEHVSEVWMAKAILNGGAPLKALSVPCATGEEPYSIAMSLLACGLTPNLFSIDAMDINLAVIEKAQKGSYSKNSFRGSDLAFRDRHFKERAGRYQINEELKGLVSFSQGNLLETPVPEKPVYDIVFCRNMLIYFDTDSQHRAIDILRSLLKEDGVLFLGHAESGIMLGKDFKHVDARGSFAFRKHAAKPALAPKATRAHAQPKTEQAPKAPDRKEAPPHRKHERQPRPHQEPVRHATGDEPTKREERQDLALAKAEDLANKGDFVKAAELCDEHIKKAKLDPEGYLLKGVIMMALKKNDEAEKLLGKAIFLKADSYEALLHLAGIKDQNGDAKAAKLLRERAGRARRQ